MSHPELLLIRILLALVQVALLSLIGQGLLALLAGARRDSNPIYMVFKIVTRPLVRAARFITPKFVLDKHLPFVAFFVLFWLGLVLAWAKRAYCATHGLACL
jgi:uncharacterized protein YggT (Ycf19 family)